MNKLKFEQLSIAYVKGLEKAIIDKPEDYGLVNVLPHEYALHVGTKQLLNIEEGRFYRNAYTGSAGWKNACKALGIKHTEKAIRAFLELDAPK